QESLRSRRRHSAPVPKQGAAGTAMIEAVSTRRALLDLEIPGAGDFDDPAPGETIDGVQAMFIELALTVGLVSTILGTASRAQNVGPLSAVGAGGYIALAGLWSSPISGASMNPARSFGPDLVLLDFANYWVYIVGPLAGAVIAVAIALDPARPG